MFLIVLVYCKQTECSKSNESRITNLIGMEVIIFYSYFQLVFSRSSLFFLFNIDDHRGKERSNH